MPCTSKIIVNQRAQKLLIDKIDTWGPDVASSPSIWRARGIRGRRTRFGGIRSSQRRDMSHNNTEPELKESLINITVAALT